MENLTQKSKYLSLLLRHKPEKANLKLDKNGWCKIDDLVREAGFTKEELTRIVETDNKRRYSIDGARIRANQGHSVKVEVDSIKKTVPPFILYHGAKHETYLTIRKEGLKKMNRNHVHLSEDLETAQKVGDRRKGITCIFEVHARDMHANGYSFYLSENGVWLTDSVPPQFLTLKDLS